MATGSPDISYPCNPSVARVRWASRPIRFEAPWSGAVQVLDRWGRWELELTWDLMTMAQAQQLLGALGRYGDHTAFSLCDPSRLVPTGNATVAQLANLLVKGAGQVGKSLLVDGGPEGTLILKAGDLIGIASTGECYEVRSDVTTTTTAVGPPAVVGGEATITLNQAIRTSPADNAPVLVSYVPITVRLAEPIERESQTNSITSIRIRALEDIT
jgi:hypothetical protein